MEDDLPEDKQNECKEVFDLFDRDKDGAITLKELGDILRALGASPEPTEVESIFKETDTDKSGKLEFLEFMNIFKTKINFPGLYEDLIEAFKNFDKEGSGNVSVQEFKHVMTTLGDVLSEEEVDELIKEADTNEEGSIKYVVFVGKMVGNAEPQKQ